MPNTALQCLELIRPDGERMQGLFPVQKRGPEFSDLRVDEQAAVVDAGLLKNIDFVFFRQFSDGRSSQVAAYIVDNSNERYDEAALSKLHKQVWLHGTAPLLYVAWPSRIDILACARGPDFWGNNEERYKPAETIRVAAEISAELQERSRFSAFRLSDGTFWEDPRNKELADHEKAAHQSLIQAVVEADKDLGGGKKPVLRRLLLLMVLVKYLEDRGVFPGEGWFGRFRTGARSFFEVLQGCNPDEVIRLLEFLRDKFNGDVFDLTGKEREELTNKTLDGFADLVEARTLNRQRYLWEQFSFKHLPVEIISHLYQHFVQGGHGEVYTPPFLASLLLDHAMPYGKLLGTERVLDPACGSGVFLVGAFRRLTNIWRSKNNWDTPDVPTLKQILHDSIYGIELDPFAVDLTSFSLSLAICDALRPEIIWRDLKFDHLRESNLYQADFFAKVFELREGRPCFLDEGFDVIIGNPPFESSLSDFGKLVDKAAKKKDKSRGNLPDKQAAYLFLEQALAILRAQGRVCLIQPSTFLYSSKAKAFRHSIFRNSQVQTILDFTSIRDLYEADPKTIAVFALLGKPKENHRIDHWTFRRTTSVHERICFELDHYDRHRVTQTQAQNDDPYVWRAGLLGGGRLAEMSQRLRCMRTLVQYVSQNGWDYGEGFIAAKRGHRTPAPFLTGRPLLPTTALTDEGIDEARIKTVTETHFRSAYTEDRFTAPLVLIKEIESLPIAYRERGFLAYRHQIVGIHAPRSQSADLRRLCEFLCHNKEFYRFCCTLNGTQSLAGKATAVLKQDIDALPYPEDVRDIALSFWENILCEDVVKYMTEYVRRGQNSPLLRKAASSNDLGEYSSMFCRMLGSIYGNLGASEPVFLDGLTCQPFYFGDHPDFSWLGQEVTDGLRKLVYYQNHEHLRTVRVLRYYEKNVILIVKPDRLRYWIRSTAIRDADETLMYLREQGY